MKAGWQVKTLGESCFIARGGSPRPIQEFLTNDADGVNWIKISDATASDKFIFKTKEKIKPSGISRSRLVKEGDFILSNSMSFGRPYVMKTSGCIHDGWLVLSEYEKYFDQGFLYHLLGSPVVFEQFNNLAAGSTVRNLNIELASRVVLPVPPIEQQQRLVFILDQAFEGIAKARVNAEQNLQNARALFASHLQSVFTQRGEGWTEEKLADLCEVKDGTHDSPQYVPAGIPFVTQKNIRENGLSFETTKYITAVDHQKFYKRSNATVNDLLISMIGANRGMACLVDDNRVFSIKNVGLIKSNHLRILPKFLLYFLKSPKALGYVKAQSKGGAQEFIGLTELRKFPIVLPGLSKQQIIISQLDGLSSETQRLEALYQRKIALMDELKKSLLQQAFAGEL